MKINSILKVSEANGPGKRGVVWVQGCLQRCEGCFNPEAQDFCGGKDLSVKEIIKEFSINEIEGITVSGGEPFEQAEELLLLLQNTKALGLNTLVYSGYTFDYLYKEKKDVLYFCDFLIDGPFKQNIPSNCKWAGSGNQHFYKLENGMIKEDLTNAEEYSKTAEIIIDATGNILITGFLEK